VSYLRIRIRVQPAGGAEVTPDERIARKLFRRWNGFPADLVLRRRRSWAPPVLVQLGRLRGVIYSSDKGRRDRVRTYIHFMERPPILASDPAGRQLFIVGGNYRVTERGIEG
jgi:hypothetical protein